MRKREQPKIVNTNNVKAIRMDFAKESFRILETMSMIITILTLALRLKRLWVFKTICYLQPMYIYYAVSRAFNIFKIKIYGIMMIMMMSFFKDIFKNFFLVETSYATENGMVAHISFTALVMDTYSNH